MDEPEKNPYRSPSSSRGGGSRRSDDGRFPWGAVVFSSGVVTSLLFSNSFDVDTDPPWKLTEVLGCVVFILAIAAMLVGLLLITVRFFDKG
ncbi:MAG TPA: hypothetical protein VF278_08925 [Pirellulales bacterium]